MTLSPSQREHLDSRGYLILPDFFVGDMLNTLRSEVERRFAAEGESAGSEFRQEPGCRRLANLVDKGEIFRQVIALPALLPFVEHVLGPEFKLSSLNVRSINPGHDQPQPLHADMAAIADDRGYWVCNTVWMLDDFTADNGPIRIIPGSHRWGKLPAGVLDDPTLPHPDEEWLTGTAGTVVVMNAHLWHGGLPNHSAAPRRALHAFYARRDKPQQQYQKQLLRPEVQSELSPKLREILALDDRLNDQLSAAPECRSGFLK